MGDENNKPWFDKNDIVTIIGAIFSGLALLISTWNSTQLNRVQTKQDTHERKAEDIQVALDASKRETYRKLDKIEKTTEEVDSKVGAAISKKP